jgi:FkbM family methyltransferase
MENMELASFVYKKILQYDGHGLMLGFWTKCRWILIKWFKDPTCEIYIHERYLQMPLSHELPLYLKKFLFYDRLPGRISEFIRQCGEPICCIDVGANIGDTVAAFGCRVTDKDMVLAIEPNEHFRQYLISNWGEVPNVTISAYLCSSISINLPYRIVEKKGTASILSDINGNILSTKSLDDIILENPNFKGCNVLKIDTDGHDFQVIAGARNLIASSHPAVLFECDKFSNENYVEDVLNSLRLFLDVGYSCFFLYDNFGYFMGKYPLSDLSSFVNLIFYQLTSPFCYFDILVLKEEYVGEFWRRECDYFTSVIVSGNNSIQSAFNPSKPNKKDTFYALGN